MSLSTKQTCVHAWGVVCVCVCTVYGGYIAEIDGESFCVVNLECRLWETETEKQ